MRSVNNNNFFDLKLRELYTEIGVFLKFNTSDSKENQFKEFQNSKHFEYLRSIINRFKRLSEKYKSDDARSPYVFEALDNFYALLERCKTIDEVKLVSYFAARIIDNKVTRPENLERVSEDIQAEVDNIQKTLTMHVTKSDFDLELSALYKKLDEALEIRQPLIINSSEQPFSESLKKYEDDLELYKNQLENHLKNLINEFKKLLNRYKPKDTRFSYIIESLEQLHQHFDACKNISEVKLVSYTIASIINDSIKAPEFPKEFAGDTKAAVEKIHKNLITKLKSYDKSLQDGFTEIFNQYGSFLHFDNFELREASLLGYTTKRYFYSGSLEGKEPFQSLIHLIDRLALIDKSYVKEIYDFFKSFPEFNYTHLELLLENIYDIFHKIQKNNKQYLTQLTVEKTKILANGYVPQKVKADDKIAKMITITADNKDAKGTEKSYTYEELIRIYCENILLEKKKSNPERLKLMNKLETIFAKDGIPLGKLKHDIDIFAEELHSKEDELNRQLRLLKKDVNHLTQQLGFGSRLKKTSKVIHLDENGVAHQSKIENGNLYTLLPEAEETVSPEKLKKRKIKKQNSRISTISAAAVAFGEGAVAAVGMLTAASLILAGPIAIVIAIFSGIGGAFCNYYLTKDDTKDVLDTFRLGKLFKDTHGKEVSRIKKFLIAFFGALSIATGLAYAGLSYMSISGITTSLFAGLVSSKALMLVITLTFALLPTVATAICLTCLFFIVIADFIKNERWKDIAKIIKNTFLNIPWKELTIGEKLSHVVKCVFFEFPKFILAPAITLVVTLASFSVFLGRGIAFLLTLPLLGPLMGAGNAKNIFFGFSIANGTVSTFFGIKKIYQQLQSITVRDTIAFIPKLLPRIAYFSASLLVNICRFASSIILGAVYIASFPAMLFTGITNYKSTFRKALGKVTNLFQRAQNVIKKHYQKIANRIDAVIHANIRGKTFAEKRLSAQKMDERDEQENKKFNQLNPLQKLAHEANQLTKTTLDLSIGINGLGQGGLMGTADPSGLRVVLPVSAPLAQGFSAVCETQYSNSGNSAAAKAAIHAVTVLPAPKDVNSNNRNNTLKPTKKSEFSRNQYGFFSKKIENAPKKISENENPVPEVKQSQREVEPLQYFVT